MAVDLRILPDKLALPEPPRHRRWSLMVLSCSLIAGGLVVLLWPQSQWRMSLWFWCCAVVLPLVAGLVVYALRLLAYERRRDYAQSWNQSHEEQEQVLIRQGRRALALLATAYCSGAGNNKIAQALRLGSKPLQPVYFETIGQTLRVSQLAPPAQSYTHEEYAQRLRMHMQRVLTGLDPELHSYTGDLPLCVRIRHNQVLGDTEVLSLWHAARLGKGTDDQVIFAMHDDGLMWLDAWLDDLSKYRILLSLEINLFLDPVADQAESVSGVLLGISDAVVQKITPMAWIHRPVQMGDPARALQDAFFWGSLLPQDKKHFTWITQVTDGVLRDARIASRAACHLFDDIRCQSLDNSFGFPGCAVGNVSLLLAGEQASADRQPQVVMMQDVSTQVFVVRPA